MQKVSVFFAGSTTLSDERNQIKALANDLNAKYEKKGVQVVVYTYEYLGENQDTYNHFVANEADAAIFVLKERINEYTLEELRKAIEARKAHGHPHIFVFLQAIDDNIESNKEIRDTIKQHLGRQHYIDYKNSEDLKTKTRERLVPIAEEHLKRGRILRALCTLAAFIALIGLAIFSYFSYSNSELLLIAGGGSVANYIRDVKHIDLNKRENTACLRMGSKLALPLLAEDGFNYSNSRKNNMKCIPVVMSAGKANNNDLLKSGDPNLINDLPKTLRIMECWVGKDTLKVYIDKKWYRELTTNHDIATNQRISISKLDSLLRNRQDSVQVFSTSPESGTRTAYKKLLRDYGYSDTLEGVETFHDQFDPDYKSLDGKHIFLCSQSFRPEHDIENLQALIVTDPSDNACTKDLYLYFPAYKNPNNKYSIPRCIMRLLEDIGVNHTPHRGFGAFEYPVNKSGLFQEYKPS